MELADIKQKEEEYEQLSKDARVCAEEPQHRAPTLLSSLANLTVTEGEAIELSVDLSGHPPPSIQWSMEKTLENDEKCCLSFDGRKEASAIKEKEAQYQQSSKDARMKGTETQEPPTLHKNFSNLDVTEGDEIGLEATLKGFPIPIATWSFEKVLVPDTKKTMSYDGETARLTIQNCDTSDEGMYKIRLQNSLGEVSSTAQVNVHKRH